VRASRTPGVADGVNHGRVDGDCGFEQESVQDELVLLGIPFDRHLCKDSGLRLVE